MASIRKGEGDKKKAARILRETVTQAGASAPKARGAAQPHLITPDSERGDPKAAEVLHQSLRDPAESAGPAPHLIRPDAGEDPAKAAEILHATVRDAAGPAVAMAEADRAASHDFPEVAHHFAAAAEFPERSGKEAFPREAAAPNLAAVTGVAGVLARGFQDISQEWLALAQGRVQKNMEALNALSRCRSLPELVALQTRFLQENLREAGENNRRIAEVSMRVAREAANAMTSGANSAKRPE